MKINILERWDITIEELTQLVDENPSLRGFIMGYLAEYKMRQYLIANPLITNLRKFDDHDRKNKHDLVVAYKGKDFSFEFKSLQTNTIIKTSDETYTAVFQCDASDKRKIELPDGRFVETTCLRFGDFDIVGVSIFHFTNKWEFAFALNRDLPMSQYKKYPDEIRCQLIKSSIPITYPIQPPFVSDPVLLLEYLYLER